MDYRSTLTVKIITNETFRAHQGFGLALFRDATMPPSTLLTYRVAKQEPFLDFKSRLAQALRYQPNQFRLGYCPLPDTIANLEGCGPIPWCRRTILN
ncbi:hypothetical protein H4Q26_005834 [Puccinia striiformis f. sp. tritici PST-130]|nr:hypothetical protein H4Q26_005834 [Puccinia striiformis f. sp. tritici PST-130]